ncbi:MAG: hypothetical protein IPM64_17790, partial [Phycisphaerales bacterium]|nr:hypothetical protein [Phycisphaerales bacterium]
MSDQAIIALVIGVLGLIGWLSHVSYRIGRIYSLMQNELLRHREQLKHHDRRIGAP